MEQLGALVTSYPAKVEIMTLVGKTMKAKYGQLQKNPVYDYYSYC